MKKLLTVLVLVAMLFTLGACGQKEEEPAAPAEVAYKLGMGTVVGLDESKAGNAQVDATVAAVILDAEGKIVACTIDVAQSKTAIAEDGSIETEGVTFLSKQEKQFDYNMVKYSEATLEWFEQANNFAAYCVGKTADEVAATAIKERDDHIGHDGYHVAADADLFAVCSISIPDFVEAVVKACKDEQGKDFTSAVQPALGLKLDTELDLDSSKSATAEEDGAANMYTTYAAAAVVDGKIVAAVLDAIQPKISFDATGEITSAAFKATKRELKEDYNMVKYAADCDKEWYVQSANLTDYVAGKTAAEVAGIEIVERNDGVGHDGYKVAADADLFAICSIQINGIVKTIAAAVDNAK